MRAFAVHDSAGNIVSVGVPNNELEGDLELVPEEGHSVTEFDLGSVRPEGPDAVPDAKDAIARAIADIVHNYVVDVGDGKLVRRPGAAMPGEAGAASRPSPG